MYDLKAVDRAVLAADLTELGERGPLSVALLDIDQLAVINRTHGQQVGDRVLALVVGTIAVSLTDTEGTLVRTSGDEFGVILPGNGPEEALILMETARAQLARGVHRFAEHEVAVSISVGVASFPQHVDDPTKLLEAAEAALYRAKTDGKGRVAIFVEDKMILKSNYYAKPQLSKLATLADRLDRTEASLLREALSAILDKYQEYL